MLNVDRHEQHLQGIPPVSPMPQLPDVHVCGRQLPGQHIILENDNKSGILEPQGQRKAFGLLQIAVLLLRKRS